MATDISDKSLSERVRELVVELSPEEQSVLMGVIRAEQDKIHMKTVPKGINDEIWKVILGVIK